MSFLKKVTAGVTFTPLKFTPAQGSVSIHARTMGDMVEATVTDTGIGIKAEILEQFRNEGQLASSMGTDKEIGTGLGLHLSTKLLNILQGTADVVSEYGKGTTFTVEFTRKLEEK